jgi:hypothetical protein
MSFGYYPLKKGNKYHIRLRYTYSKSSRTDFYPQVVISNIKFFNPESLSQPIRKNNKDADRLNRFLKNYVREIEEIIDTIRYNKKLPTAKLVKERFEAKKLVKMQDANNDAEINQFSVIKTIDAYIKDAAVRVKIGDGLTDSSYEKMNRIMNKWKAYFKEKGNSSIQFEDLNLKLDLFKDFAQWCLNDDNKFANSSINKYSTTFRSFLKWSLRKSYHNINIKKFDSPNLKEVSNHSILALTPDQLKYMFSFDKFNYLAKAEGCDVIIIDPIQAGVNSSDNGAIIEFMDTLLKFAKETDTSIIAVSHMRKPSDENPHAVTEYQLMGSSSINQIAFNTILISRDKMNPDPVKRSCTKLQLVKCRRTGNTGEAGWLRYDHETTHLFAASNPYAESPEQSKEELRSLNTPVQTKELDF